MAERKAIHFTLMDLSDRIILTKPVYIQESAEKCGYCRGQKQNPLDYEPFRLDDDSTSQSAPIVPQNCTIGFQTEHLSIEQYDFLCNMNYRRSGTFIYKTDMLRNCCRLHTIRTSPKDYFPTKEYRKCVTRFRKFIKAPTINKPKNQKKNNPTSSNSYNYFEEIRNLHNSPEFEVKLEPPLFTMEKYQLFKKFQNEIHNDLKTSEKSFKRFLCNTPFPQQNLTTTTLNRLCNWYKYTPSEPILGPLHQCYYYKGALIALGVIDILPSGISSVYFIYDPEYKSLSLGKLSALYEMALCEAWNLKWYYLGYYVHDCTKMRYKGSYGGELLDIVNNKFIPLKLLKEEEKNELFAFSPNETVDTLNREMPINDTLGRPSELNTKLIPFEKMSNVTTKLYKRDGFAFQHAASAIEQLSNSGVSYSAPIIEDEEDTFKPIPAVLPGLVPLWEIAELVDSGKINAVNYKTLIYEVDVGTIRFIEDFHSESSNIKRIICDVVRCIGLTNTTQSLIII